jgi:NAD(P)-dependent dehydrogenase (short-subunit alcohol dehydrogenase family)
MAGQVEGKVALVTGAASGIGAACADLLAQEGAAVLMTDIDTARGEALAATINGRGQGRAHFMHQDVTEEARWPEVVSEAEQRFGGLQILVCNAGIGIMVPSVLDMSLAEWRRQMAINVDGVFLNVKHGVPAIRRAGKGGSVVMISSVAGLRGSAGLAGYSATKGAVRLFAKSLALECAGARDGIRVNSIHPGIIATPIWEKIPAGMGGGRNAPIDPHALASTSVPIGVASEARDIAEGVLWLASDASRHVTGSELVIDGGMMAGRASSLVSAPTR